MSHVLFRNVRVFDGASEDLRDGCEVLVADGVIQKVSESPVSAGAAEVVDCGGRVLMPGLIDAHVHVYAASVNLARVVRWPSTYLAHFAARFLEASLDRGFTTVRDVGGGDIGLANALRDGLVQGPRLFYGGRVISQTGGHGDLRPGDSELEDVAACACACHADAIAIIADGVDAVRRAVREELRRGASHIKIMGSGGSRRRPIRWTNVSILTRKSPRPSTKPSAWASTSPPIAIRRRQSAGASTSASARSSTPPWWTTRPRSSWPSAGPSRFRPWPRSLP